MSYPTFCFRQLELKFLELDYLIAHGVAQRFVDLVSDVWINPPGRQYIILKLWCVGGLWCCILRLHSHCLRGLLAFLRRNHSPRRPHRPCTCSSEPSYDNRRWRDSRRKMGTACLPEANCTRATRHAAGCAFYNSFAQMVRVVLIVGHSSATSAPEVVSGN